MQTVTIDAELPSLNEYINVERTNRFAASKLKRTFTDYCKYYTMAAMKDGVQFNWPCKLRFKWYMKNKRKDPDNVAFAKKFILDGFMAAGFLEIDNVKHITGFTDEFYIDKDNPRVEIEEWSN